MKKTKKSKVNRRLNHLILMAAAPIAYREVLKRILKSIRQMMVLAVCAAALWGIFAVVPVQAATTVDVTASAYGAKGTDTKDDTAAIQKALDLAKNTKKYTSSNHLIVKIPKGTYYLTNTLYICSNTDLKLASGTTIIMKSNDVYYMLRNKHIHSDGTTGTGGSAICTSSKCGGYTQSSNITVTGGTWKQSQKADCATGIISIRHAQNISISGVKSYYATDHYFNLSATKKVTVTDCDFYNARTYSGNTEYQAKESIHLDSADAEGEPNLFPKDNTPCSYVTVTGCTFTKVHGGVGTHHTTATRKGTDIVVTDCKFTNLDGRAINFANFNDSKATGNTVSGADVFMTVLSGDNVTVSGNTAKNTNSSFFKGYQSTNLKVKNNTFTNGSLTDTNNTNGMYFETVSGTISGNTLKNVPGNGIYFKFGGTMTITGNTVSDCGYFGIIAMGDSSHYAVPTITKNTASDCGVSGIKVGDYCRNALVEDNSTWSYVRVGAPTENLTIRNNLMLNSTILTDIQSVTNTSSGICVTWVRAHYGGYQIWRSENGGSWKRVRSTDDLSVISWTDKNVTAGSTYRYKIRRTFDSYKYYTPFSTSKTIVRLKQPAITSVTGKTGRVVVQADPCSLASGYEIQAADNTSFTDPVTVSATGAFPASGKAVKGLTTGTHYYVRFRFVKTVSGKKYVSAWSKYKGATVK